MASGRVSPPEVEAVAGSQHGGARRQQRERCHQQVKASFLKRAAWRLRAVESQLVASSEDWRHVRAFGAFQATGRFVSSEHAAEKRRDVLRHQQDLITHS